MNESTHETNPDSSIAANASPLALVREFHEKYGLPVGTEPAFPDNLRERQLRIGLLHEEFGEYKHAEITSDLVGVADALGDMVCVIYGTALSYGIDLDAVVAEIHRSNMTKTRDPEMNYPAKNVRKLAGYEPPRLAEVLGV